MIDRFIDGDRAAVRALLAVFLGLTLLIAADVGIRELSSGPSSICEAYPDSRLCHRQGLSEGERQQFADDYFRDWRPSP